MSKTATFFIFICHSSLTKKLYFVCPVLKVQFTMEAPLLRHNGLKIFTHKYLRIVCRLRRQPGFSSQHERPDNRHKYMVISRRITECNDGVVPIGSVSILRT